MSEARNTTSTVLSPGDTMFRVDKIRREDMDVYLSLGFISRPEHVILKELRGSMELDDLLRALPMSEAEARVRIAALERRGLVARSSI